MPLHKESEQLTQELALWLIPGHNQRRLVKHYLATATSPDLAKVTAVELLEIMANSPAFKDKTRQLARLALHNPWQLPFANLIKMHLIWVEQDNHHLIFLADQPNLLQQLVDPPLMLSVIGEPKELQAPSLAVVGSRQLSPEGEHLADNWSYQLAWQGLNIVSGLARGVDSHAHLGALRAVSEGAAATSCAVLAHGLDSIYPPEHNKMANDLLTSGGALISEYSLGTPPLPRYFPARNRIVTGLSLGVLVVEATLRSGSLVSARHAMEQGREVMAIPGSVRRRQSEGCHQLIRQGAALVTGPEEVLAEISTPLKTFLPTHKAEEANPQIAEHLQPLYCLMHDAPQSADELLSKLKINAEQGLVLLQELALEGLIVQQPGGWCRSV